MTRLTEYLLLTAVAIALALFAFSEFKKDVVGQAEQTAEDIQEARFR